MLGERSQCCPQADQDPASLGGDRVALGRASSLLKAGDKDVENALLYAVTLTRGETIRRQYTREQAYGVCMCIIGAEPQCNARWRTDCRDAMAKALYGRLFSWIVSKVNELLAPALHQHDASRLRSHSTQTQGNREIGMAMQSGCAWLCLAVLGCPVLSSLALSCPLL